MNRWGSNSYRNTEHLKGKKILRCISHLPVDCSAVKKHLFVWLLFGRVSWNSSFVFFMDLRQPVRIFWLNEWFSTRRTEISGRAFTRFTQDIWTPSSIIAHIYFVFFFFLGSNVFFLVSSFVKDHSRRLISGQVSWRSVRTAFQTYLKRYHLGAGQQRS